MQACTQVYYIVIFQISLCVATEEPWALPVGVLNVTIAEHNESRENHHGAPHNLRQQ
jgi:hypothetical protein